MNISAVIFLYAYLFIGIFILMIVTNFIKEKFNAYYVPTPFTCLKMIFLWLPFIVEAIIVALNKIKEENKK